MTKTKLLELKKYFREKPEISMAFLFGSESKGTATSESDADIGIYYTPTSRALEFEESKTYKDEGRVWLDLERIIGKNTDMVVLNRAPAPLADAIIREGTPIIIKDRALYWRFFLLITLAAEDFRGLVQDWREIKERSQSLSEQDRERLTRIVDFLKTELQDLSRYAPITQRIYETDRDKKRALERWVENIVNASIDIAKILLASEKQPIPETYSQVIAKLTILDGFQEKTVEQLAEFTKLRNILAHEYLDLRFVKIAQFMKAAETVYGELIAEVEKRL